MDKPGNRHQSDQTFFVTSVIEGREPIFRNDEYAQKFIDALQHFRNTNEIKLYGFEILRNCPPQSCRGQNLHYLKMITFSTKTSFWVLILRRYVPFLKDWRSKLPFSPCRSDWTRRPTLSKTSMPLLLINNSL